MYFFPVIGEKKGDSFALSRTPTEKKKKNKTKERQTMITIKETDWFTRKRERRKIGEGEEYTD